MENRRNSFEFDDLLACGRGEMFPEGPQLPLPLGASAATPFFMAPQS